MVCPGSLAFKSMRILESEQVRSPTSFGRLPMLPRTVLDPWIANPRSDRSADIVSADDIQYISRESSHGEDTGDPVTSQSPECAIPNAQSRIRDPKCSIPNLQSRIRNPESGSALSCFGRDSEASIRNGDIPMGYRFTKTAENSSTREPRHARHGLDIVM